jgi:hypothetical protein
MDGPYSPYAFLLVQPLAGALPMEEAGPRGIANVRVGDKHHRGFRRRELLFIVLLVVVVDGEDTWLFLGFAIAFILNEVLHRTQ